MIDVRQAVKIAMEFVQNIFGDWQISRPMLEEVELADDGSIWRVTVSYLREKPSQVADLFQTKEQERVYRAIRLSREDGSFLGMTKDN